MQVLTLVFGLSAILASVNAGGYTAKGGVFDFKKPLDYYDSAVNAGKYAWSKRIEDEQTGGQVEAERGSRQAQAYLPTYFTSEDNLEQLEATRREARTVKESNFEGPLFYSEYHNRR